MLSLHGVGSIPIPLHIDIGSCRNDCRYCFITNKQKTTSFKQIENAINKKYDGSLKSYYLESRYPVCINNNSDFFNTDDKEIFEKIKILKDAGFPVYFQTKGYHDNKEFKLFQRIINKLDCLYITITSFTNNNYENNLPVIESKINLIEYCIENNILVNVGFNPLITNQITQDEIIKFMDKYKNKNIYYVAYPIHGVKNIHKNQKEINPVARKENFKTDKIRKFAKDNNIVYRDKTVFSIDLESYGNKLKQHFNKEIIIGSDLDLICKEVYENSDKKNLIGVDFNLFKEKYKKDFLKINIKKSEIRTMDNFLSKNLPDVISYENYIHILWNNPKTIRSFTGFSNAVFLSDADRKKDMVYYYPFQDSIIERVKNSRRYQHDFKIN